MSGRAWSDVVHVWSTSEGVHPQLARARARRRSRCAARARRVPATRRVARRSCCREPCVRRSIDGRAPSSRRGAITRQPVTIDGVCLPHIWEVELLAEVFLPETRVVVGLQAALGKQAVRQVVCEGLDEGRLAALRWALEPGGVVVSTTGSAGRAGGLSQRPRIALATLVANAGFQLDPRHARRPEARPGGRVPAPTGTSSRSSGKAHRTACASSSTLDRSRASDSPRLREAPRKAVGSGTRGSSPADELGERSVVRFRAPGRRTRTPWGATSTRAPSR